MYNLQSSTIHFLSFFLAVFTIARIIKFIPTMPAPIYYGIWGVIALIIIYKGFQRINYATLLFISLCLLSILGNSIDAKYSIWLRFVGFLLIVMSVGPSFDGSWLYMLRKYSFHYVSMGLVVVTIISFIIYCISPTLMLTERGQLYGGVTLHSMLMGPISGISTVYLTYRYTICKHRNRLRYKLLFATCICVSILSCVLAGSRSAILAMVGSDIVFLYLYNRNNIRAFVKILVCVAVLVAVTSPLWWSYTETVQNKMALSEINGGFMLSRTSSWEARIDEFLQSPFIGCGFATVVGAFSERGDEGMVEPGNGWLFILSSTGIFSFILFVSMYIRYVVQLVRDLRVESILLVSTLFFLGLHLNAEGYTLSSGTFLFFYLWLSIGYTYSYLFKK